MVTFLRDKITTILTEHRMLKKFILPILALLFAITAGVSHATDNIRIPDKGLHYALTLVNLPKTTVFRGKMQLEGELLMSWYKLENGKSNLDLTFTPLPVSRQKLPYINDAYNEPNIHIGINELPLDKPRRYDNKGNLISKNAKLPNNMALVKPYFTDIPAAFWQNKTGEISRPAQITITEFGMEIECDTRNYYATAVAIRPLNQKSTLAFPKGC